MVYVTSDIHGRINEFNMILEKIKFNLEDEMYILGDVLDKGVNSIELLLQIINIKNIHLLLGNHEILALLLLEFCMDNKNVSTDEIMSDLKYWSLNGGYYTVRQFKNLNENQQKDILIYLRSLEFSKDICINNQNYLLAHSYMPAIYENSNFSLKKNLNEIIRIDYKKQYFKDKIFISGHTPNIKFDCDFKSKIYKNEFNICLDCGMNNLGCLCLDTLQEYYV